MELLKLLAILALIIFALRRKVSVGVTLFLAGLLAALLYQVSFERLLAGYWSLIKSDRFLSLTAVIVLVTILGQLLKQLGFLRKLAESCTGIYGGNRTAVALLPFLIGLMPMPGGALLSAPLVDNVLVDTKYTAEFKTVANYWFRHLVEFFWPIYPGIILTEAITGMPMLQVSIMQLPLSLMMLAIGAIFFSRHIDRVYGLKIDLLGSALGILKALWPIAGAIAVFAILKVDMAWAVLAALLALIVATRPSKALLLPSLRHGLSWGLIFMVFGILSFQTVLELSGAITAITDFARQMNFSADLMIVSVCFSIGFLTGMTAAFVGMGYVLLAGFLYQPAIVPGHILLAYLSGYVGMLLSPTHLCLILTNNYFKSNLIQVYRVLAVPLLLLAMTGYLLSHSPWVHFFGNNVLTAIRFWGILY